MAPPSLRVRLWGSLDGLQPLARCDVGQCWFTCTQRAQKKPDHGQGSAPLYVLWLVASLPLCLLMEELAACTRHWQGRAHFGGSGLCPALAVLLTLVRPRHCAACTAWLTFSHAPVLSAMLVSWLQRLKSVDFYRKLPTDLTEATLSGAAISIATTFIILFLLGAVRREALTKQGNASAESLQAHGMAATHLPIFFGTVLGGASCLDGPTARDPTVRQQLLPWLRAGAVELHGYADAHRHGGGPLGARRAAARQLQHLLPAGGCCAR